MSDHVKKSEEEIIGKNCYRITHQNTTKCSSLDHTCPVAKMLETSKPVTVEHIHKDFQGQPLYFEVTAYPIINKDGTIDQAVHVARDLTEHKKYEQILHEERTVFRGIIENTEAMIAYFDLDFNFVIVNSAYAQGSGYPADTLIGKNHFELFPNKDNQAIFEKVKATGKPAKFFDKPFKFANEPKRGVTYWEWILSPVKNSQGKTQGFVMALIETTERKKAEEKLRERQEKYRQIIELAEEGIWFAKPNGETIFVNKKMADMLGYEKDYFIGKTGLNFLAKGQKRLVMRTRKELGNNKRIQKEYHFHRKDGTTLWTIAKVAPIFENGKHIANIAMHTDITKRKKVEQALNQSQVKLEKYNMNLERLVEERAKKIKEAEENYRKLYESFDEAFIAVDWGLTIIHWNKAAERVTNVAVKDALGKKIYDVLPEAMSVNFESYYEALAEKKPARFMMNVKSRQTGKLSVFEISTYPSKQGIIIIVVDKTEEEETKRLSAIGQTAGMVGHDIRNPLQAIDGALYLAKGSLETIPDCVEKQEILESMKNIESNLSYVDKIVQDLQDYTRKLQPTMKAVDLKEVCERLLFTERVSENIDVILQIDKQVKTLITDHTMLRRLLNNLFDNSVQVMPEGGKLEVRAYRKNRDCVIEVKDTGKGIPDEVKPKLFMPLFTTKSKGQGFGLAATKRLVEALGGTISFESQIGLGTRFVIYLPQNGIKKR